MNKVARKIVPCGLILSFLLGSSTLYAANARSPYFREAFEEPNIGCGHKLSKAPRNIISHPDLRELYYEYRDNQKYREENLSFSGEHSLSSDESWFGFNIGNIRVRYHIYDVNTSTKTEYMLFVDKADFRDLENLYDKLSKLPNTQGAARVVLEELVLRSLALQGDDYLLIRATLIAARDQSNLEVPNLLAIRERREITSLAQEILRGAKIFFGNADAHPRVKLLLSRILKYGYINADIGVVSP